MRGWKIITVFCILSLVILEFQQVHGQNLAIGQRCKRDGQCASGHCCGFLRWKRCRECCNNWDCPSGQTCKKKQCIGGGGGGATTNIPNGQTCDNDDQCQSNNCCGGRCWECCRTRDCLAGQTCRKRICVAAGAGRLGKRCTSNSQCDSGLNCCGVWPFRGCWPCCNDNDCENGMTCRNRFCRVE